MGIFDVFKTKKKLLALSIVLIQENGMMDLNLTKKYLINITIFLIKKHIVIQSGI